MLLILFSFPSRFVKGSNEFGTIIGVRELSRERKISLKIGTNDLETEMNEPRSTR